MKKLLICDIRNNSQVYKLLATLLSKGINKNDKILLLIKKNINFSIVKSYFNNIDFIFYEGRVDDTPVIKNLIKNKYNKFKIELDNYLNNQENFYSTIFISSFNKGCWYVYLVGLIKNKIKSFYLISFDDGYDNIRKINYFNEFKFTDFLKRIFMKFFSKHRVKNISKFDYLSTNEYFTSYVNFDFTGIYNKVSHYNNNLLKIYDYVLKKNKILQNYKNKRFIFLLTHHAVESKRMNSINYQSIISDSLKKAHLSKDDILLISKHHSETNLNSNFYEKLHYNFFYTDVPAEIILSSNKIYACISPFNTTFFQLDAMGYKFIIDLYIGYVIPKSPDIEERIKKTINIMSKNKIKYRIVNENHK